MITCIRNSAFSIKISDWVVFGTKRSWPNLGAIAVFACDLLKKKRCTSALKHLISFHVHHLVLYSYSRNKRQLLLKQMYSFMIH
jgi:hypothetical protein